MLILIAPLTCISPAPQWSDRILWLSRPGITQKSYERFVVICLWNIHSNVQQSRVIDVRAQASFCFFCY